MPRTRPSVEARHGAEKIAPRLLYLKDECLFAIDLKSTLTASKMAGMSFSGKAASTTASMIGTILPVVLMVFKRSLYAGSECGLIIGGRGRSNFKDFLGDGSLACLVVFESEVVDQLDALSVAAFIATMRAQCSEARASRRYWWARILT